jgi:hypothetical protein
VFLIWWGTRWSADRSNSKAGVELLFKEIAGSAYQSIVAQYGVFGNVALAGSRIDPVTVPPNMSCTDVWNEIGHARHTFGWVNTIDSVFFVFPQQGATFLQSGSGSCLPFPSRWCAAHGGFGGDPLALRMTFALIAYSSDSAGCLGYSANSTVESAMETSVTHEFTGVETDKVIGQGWIDPAAPPGLNEISDACLGSPVMGLASVWTARVWDNHSASCVAAGTRTDISGFAVTATTDGYWLSTRTGQVFAFGDAISRGSITGQHLTAPVLGMARTASDNGYWLVASDGGVDLSPASWSA